MNISSISLYNKALCSYMLVSYAGLMAGPNWPNFFYKSFFFVIPRALWLINHLTNDIFSQNQSGSSIPK